MFSEFEFQDGPFVTTTLFQEFIKAYLPASDPAAENQVTASPILMPSDLTKSAMPPTTIVTAQNDWLRDQGARFARKLQAAGVDCGVIQENACLHDCDVFVQSRASPTVQLAMSAIALKLQDALKD